jgi:hypothetical protein
MKNNQSNEWYAGSWNMGMHGLSSHFLNLIDICMQSLEVSGEDELTSWVFFFLKFQITGCTFPSAVSNPTSDTMKIGIMLYPMGWWWDADDQAEWTSDLGVRWTLKN